MLLHKIENDIFRSNCYIVGGENHKAVIIDPGSRNVFNIRCVIEKDSLEPEFIILTHEHFDHIFGCSELKRRYGCKIISSKICGRNAANAKRNYSSFYGQIVEIKNIDFFIEDTDYSLSLNGLTFIFHLTPGHSPGGLCVRMGNYYFSGDTILNNLKTFVRLPDSDENLLQESIQNIFRGLPKETILMPGHGDPFLLKDTSQEIIMGNKRK